MLKQDCTYLAANVPHGHRVVVGGVGSGASRVDPTEFVHVVVDEGRSYRNILNRGHFKLIFSHEKM